MATAIARIAGRYRSPRPHQWRGSPHKRLLQQLAGTALNNMGPEAHPEAHCHQPPMAENLGGMPARQKSRIARGNKQRKAVAVVGTGTSFPCLLIWPGAHIGRHARTRQCLWEPLLDVSGQRFAGPLLPANASSATHERCQHDRHLCTVRPCPPPSCCGSVSSCLPLPHPLPLCSQGNEYSPRTDH